MTTQRSERLNFRLDPEQKELIEIAASLNGQTLSSFCLSAMVTAARSVVDTQHRTELSLRDWKRFGEILENDQPNEALTEVARKVRHLYESEA